MTIIQSVILGVVEGVTEFLPISSTGHMILASKLMGIAQTDFLKSFEIIIQFGAILAIVVLYWKRIWHSKDLWKKVLVAFLPTAVIGFLLYKVLKNYLLSNVAIVLWSLFLGGIILILFEMWYARRPQHGAQELSYKKSFWTGIWQSLAIIPGVSRSGATIVGGMAMGIERRAIVEFSFLLAIPTLAAASGYDLLKSGASFSQSQIYLLILGFVVSFIVAMATIKWFVGYIQTHSFISFGVYRIAVALLFWLLVIQLKI
jgi:undecaprenyl-diphosphatase